MTHVIEGFVAKLATKSGQTARGPWTAYSAKIMDKDGNELPKWFQFGFDAPSFKEGDYIRFKAEDKDANAMTADPNSVQVAKNPPARPAQQSGGGGRRGGGGPKVTESELFGQIGGYNTEDDIRRISMTAAQERATGLLAVLAANDGLPMVKSKGAANVTKRYEALLAIHDKLTVKLFHDAVSGRLLESVSDEGEINLAGDGALPDADEFGETAEPEQESGFEAIQDGPEFAEDDAQVDEVFG